MINKLCKRSLFIDFYKNRVLEKYSNKEQKAITLKQLTVFGRSSSMNVEKLIRSGRQRQQRLENLIYFYW